LVERYDYFSHRQDDHDLPTDYEPGTFYDLRSPLLVPEPLEIEELGSAVLHREIEREIYEIFRSVMQPSMVASHYDFDWVFTRHVTPSLRHSAKERGPTPWAKFLF
jgi:hypothetical protein